MFPIHSIKCIHFFISIGHIKRKNMQIIDKVLEIINKLKKTIHLKCYVLSIFLNETKLFHGKQYLYILVMKIMLINTQGMYIFPIASFFSQLPKIKVALTHTTIKTLIPHFMNWKQVEYEVFQQSRLQLSFYSACPPTHFFQNLSAG